MFLFVFFGLVMSFIYFFGGSGHVTHVFLFGCVTRVFGWSCHTWFLFVWLCDIFWSGHVTFFLPFFSWSCHFWFFGFIFCLVMLFVSFFFWSGHVPCFLFGCVTHVFGWSCHACFFGHVTFFGLVM